MQYCPSNKAIIQKIVTFETLIASRLEKCAEEAKSQAQASCDANLANLAKENDRLEEENDSLKEEIKTLKNTMVSKKKLQRVNNDNVRLNQEIGKLQRNIVLMKGNIKGKKS